MTRKNEAREIRVIAVSSDADHEVMPNIQIPPNLSLRLIV
jgi:hypothetical protein